jgi:hypothetical protein
LSFVLWSELSIIRVGVSAIVSLAAVLFVRRVRLVLAPDQAPAVRLE